MRRAIFLVVLGVLAAAGSVALLGPVGNHYLKDAQVAQVLATGKVPWNLAGCYLGGALLLAVAVGMVVAAALHLGKTLLALVLALLCLGSAAGVGSWSLHDGFPVLHSTVRSQMVRTLDGSFEEQLDKLKELPAELLDKISDPKTWDWLKKQLPQQH